MVTDEILDVLESMKETMEKIHDRLMELNETMDSVANVLLDEAPESFGGNE